MYRPERTASFVKHRQQHKAFFFQKIQLYILLNGNLFLQLVLKANFRESFDNFSSRYDHRA